jgi:rhodanese-related sulfurtransferase
VTFLLDNLILIALAVVSGGLLLWPKLTKSGGSSALGILEATQLINHRNAIVVDVRDEKDFAGGSLAGARNVPQARLVERAAEFARFKARPVLVVCATGQQSARALATFKEQGFEEAYSLAGGIGAWKQASLPLVQPGRDTTRAAPSTPSRKARNEQQRRNKNAALTPQTVNVESVVEPAGAVGQGAAAVAATDEPASVKAV